MVGKPRQHAACTIVVSASLFACGYCAYVLNTVAGANLDASASIILAGKTAVELVASTYGEAGQARLLRESWDGLMNAGVAGGIVFEFADEWWKNYNNPARPGDWWTRVAAPDDELRHDADPEEHYGLLRADRTPKPAFTVVTAMFAEPTERHTARTVGTVAFSGMVLVAVGAWVWARRRRARRI